MRKSVVLRAAGLIGLMLVIEGCTTYQQQKADALSGGPERRVREAEQRQQAAQDAAIGLETDRQALDEEAEFQERQIADLNRQVKEQDRAITRARAQNRISREREANLRRRVVELDRDVQDAELRMLSAQATGDKSQERQLQRELSGLRTEANDLDREIETLTQ